MYRFIFVLALCLGTDNSWGDTPRDTTGDATTPRFRTSLCVAEEGKSVCLGIQKFCTTKARTAWGENITTEHGLTTQVAAFCDSNGTPIPDLAKTQAKAAEVRARAEALAAGKIPPKK